MKKRDFRRAFGDPDAAFVSTVKNTLRRLDEEEKKIMQSILDSFLPPGAKGGAENGRRS